MTLSCSNYCNSFVARSYCAQSIGGSSNSNNSGDCDVQNEALNPTMLSFDIQRSIEKIGDVMRRMGGGVLDATPYIEAMYYDALIMPPQEAITQGFNAFFYALQDAGGVPLNQGLSEQKNQDYGNMLSSMFGYVAQGTTYLDTFTILPIPYAKQADTVFDTVGVLATGGEIATGNMSAGQISYKVASTVLGCCSATAAIAVDAYKQGIEWFAKYFSEAEAALQRFMNTPSNMANLMMGGMF